MIDPDARQYINVIAGHQYDLVFTLSKGTPYECRYFYNRLFLPEVARAKTGKVRFHDLRQIFGSLKIQQGENLKYVQTQMGHSTIGVTMDCYYHLLNGANQDAANKTDVLFWGKRKTAIGKVLDGC
jgi:integrase